MFYGHVNLSQSPRCFAATEVGAAAHSEQWLKTRGRSRASSKLHPVLTREESMSELYFLYIYVTQHVEIILSRISAGEKACFVLHFC